MHIGGWRIGPRPVWVFTPVAELALLANHRATFLIPEEAGRALGPADRQKRFVELVRSSWEVQDLPGGRQRFLRASRQGQPVGRSCTETSADRHKSALQSGGGGIRTYGPP